MKFLILLLLSVTCFAESEVGWTGNVLVTDSVTQSGIRSSTVLADNQVLDPNGIAILNVDSDNAASALRSIGLLPGVMVGQKIRITCRPTGGNSQVDDDTVIAGGFIRLASNWICNQDGSSLVLFWNGTDWEEESRVIL